MRFKRFLCGLTAALTLIGSVPHAAALTDISPWATETQLAAEAGLEPAALIDAAAKDPVTRAEFAAVSLTLFESLAGYTLARTDTVWFVDCTDPDVNTAYEQGLVSGKGDGTFAPTDTITRQDLCVMLRNVLMQVGADASGDKSMLSAYKDGSQVSAYAQEAVAAMLRNDILLGSDGKLDPKGTASREQALILAYRMFKDYRLYFDAPIAGDAYGAILIPSADDAPVIIEPAEQAFSPIFVIPLNPNNSLDIDREDEDYDPPAIVQKPVTSKDEEPEEDEEEEYEEDYEEDSSEWGELAAELRAMTDAEKKLFIFGEDDPYEDQMVARENQTQVTVPVWRLNTSTGKKTESTATLTVHAALADIIEQIFIEIFEGDERFPIANVGGFAWRANTRSEHRQGTAIDINWESNMEATIEEDGSLTITSGSHWDPDKDPLSIPEDGDVVRAFKKYGFAWGGDEWTSKVDYMHFSFFGR